MLRQKMLISLLTLLISITSFKAYSLNEIRENSFDQKFQDFGIGIGVPIPMRYNLTISDTHKFVWFRVAKVGTRSILQTFSNNNVPLSINGYQLPYYSENYRDYFKFAFVRNPWDRVVSCYHNKVAGKNHLAFEECFGKDFEYFVDYINRCDLTKADIHIRLQSTLIPVRQLDFIGRFENFAEDLQYVLTMLGLENKDVPHKNISSHEHYSKYYNERTKKIIAEKYKLDIQTFGYEFEAK